MRHVSGRVERSRWLLIKGRHSVWGALSSPPTYPGRHHHASSSPSPHWFVTRCNYSSQMVFILWFFLTGTTHCQAACPPCVVVDPIVADQPDQLSGVYQYVPIPISSIWNGDLILWQVCWGGSRLPRWMLLQKVFSDINIYVELQDQ